MATNTFSGTGNWSDNARWSLGRPPTIANADKVVIATGAVCTFDAALIYFGDDTTTAVAVNGYIKWPRNMSCKLSVRGSVTFGNGNCGYDMGSEASPIPNPYVAEWENNDSAVMATAKYGVAISSANTGTLTMFGAAKTPYTTVVAANSTDSFDVADADGWRLLDVLFFGAPALSATPAAAVEARRISAITPLGGVSARITLEAPLTALGSAGRPVVNATRNVKCYAKTPETYGARWSFVPAVTTNCVFEFGYAEFVGAGASTSNPIPLEFISRRASHCRKAVGLSFHDVVSLVGSTAVLRVLLGTTPAVASWSTGVSPLEDAVFCSLGGRMRGPGHSAGSTYMIRPVVLGCTTGVSQNSQGGTSASARVVAPIVDSVNNLFFGIGYGEYLIEGGSFGMYGAAMNASNGYTSGVPLRVVGADLTARGGAFSPNPYITPQIASGFNVQFDGCTLPGGFALQRGSALQGANEIFRAAFFKNGGDPTSCIEYTPGGTIVRDNTVRLHGSASIRFEVWFDTTAQKIAGSVVASAGEVITLRGAMRYNANYGTASPPKVTASGVGLTTQTAVCPTAGVDTWHDFAVSITNTNAYPTEIVFEASGESAYNATGAYCWFDGLLIPPYTDTLREFGYLYADTAYRTVDPSITVSEATALAYPVTFDHTTGSLALTGNATANQVYQAFKASLAQTANMGVTNAQANERVYTTDGGESFSTTYSVTINTGVTLTGSFGTTGTVTLAGTGDVSGIYTDSAGRHVKITAPNLIAGTRVQLYNVTTGIELLNQSTTGAGLTFGLTYVSDALIRLLALYADGSSAKLLINATGVLTSAGLSFTNTQEDDLIYSANGVDGSIVTEYAADYPNVKMNITDPDGVTALQRLYNWAIYSQTTAAGIANYAGGIFAESAVSYVVKTAIANLKLKNMNTAGVVMQGGYLRRDDGATVIASDTVGPISFDPGLPTVAAGSQVSAAQLWSYPTRELTNGQLALADGDRLMVLSDGRYVARG